MSIRTQLLVMLWLALVAVDSQARGPLRIAVLPDSGSASEIFDTRPLIAYLSERLGTRVSQVPVADASTLISDMAAGDIDLAWIDAYSLLRLRRLDPASRALVRRPDDLASSSLIVTARHDIRQLADLRGKRFAFGSAHSTSGWLVPNILLRQEGIRPAEFFSQIAVAPYSDLALRWLVQGSSDAAVIDAQHWKRLARTTRLSGRLRIIARSDTYADCSWSVRGSLDPTSAQAIQAALLALDPARPRQRDVLQNLEAERYVAANPAPDPLIVQAEHRVGPLK